MAWRWHDGRWLRLEEYERIANPQWPRFYRPRVECGVLDA